MSEFTESAYLRSEDAKDAVELLRRAKVPGFVFPSRRGWVAFVHSQGAKVGDSEYRGRIEECNQGLLLFYDYAADHGCWVTLLRGRKPIARIKASFEHESPRFDRAVFEELGLVSPAGGAELEQWVKRAHVWHERSRLPYAVAERLGLPRYKWFSFRAELDAQRGTSDPERIEVLADGTVKSPPKKPPPHVAPLPLVVKGRPQAKTPAAPAAKRTIVKAGAVKNQAAKPKAVTKKPAPKPAKTTNKPAPKKKSR